MKDTKYDAWRLAASRFVRNQPGLFAEAARWVVSLRPKSDGPKNSGDSAAYRTVEAVVLRYRSLLDEQSKTPVETEQAAYRTILTSWLLDGAAHEPIASAGSPFDPADRPHCLRQLPVLTGREFMRLAGKYPLHTDPRWERLVFAAWKIVGDPGYLPTETQSPETVRRDTPLIFGGPGIPQAQKPASRGNAGTEDQHGDPRTPLAGSEDREPLSKQARAMFAILCSLPETEGRQAKELVHELSGKFPGIDEDRIRRLAQELKPYRIDNSRSAGYFVLPCHRPKT